MKEEEKKEPGIMPEGLPSREEILSQALAEVTESRSYVSTKREAFRDRIKLYNNQRRQRDKIGDNSIYNIINTLLAVYYTDEVQIGFVGREFGDVEKASNLENLYKFDHEEMEMDVTNYLVQWDRFFFGVGIKLLAEWNKKTQTPVARTISPLSWLPDPHGFLMMKNFRYSGFEVEYLESQLTAKNGFFNVDKLPSCSGVDKSSETEQSRAALNEAHNLNDDGSLNKESQKVYQMIDLFTCLNGKKYLITVNNDCTEIYRAEEIEPVTDEEKSDPSLVEFPVTLHYYSPDRTDPFGVSVPDLIEDKQRAKSVIKNLRVAIKKADLYPMYLYNRDKILNKRDLDFAFNKFIAVRGDVEGAVVPMNKAVARQNETINEEQLLDRDIEAATGADKVTQGITSSGERTASEIQQVTANANLRFILGSRINGWAEKRFAKLWMRLYRQNFKKEKVIRIKSAFGGNNYSVLERRSIISDTDPDIIVGSKFEIDQERTRNRVAFSTIYPLITQDPSKPKVSKTYAERYLMRLYGVSNEEIRIICPESPDEMLASQENELLSRDKFVEISIDSDDHLSHIVIHSQAETSNARNRHIEAHKMAYIESGQQTTDREMARAAMMNGGGQGQDLSRISMNQMSNQNANLTKNSNTSPVGPVAGAK